MCEEIMGWAVVLVRFYWALWALALVHLFLKVVFSFFFLFFSLLTGEQKRESVLV
jgi:hypothetical protein